MRWWRIIVGLTLAVAALFVGDVGVGDDPHRGLVESHRPDCHEYHTDYSKYCWDQATNCGNHCFYAKCHNCTPYRHCHCSFLGGCSCHTQRNPGISPCKDWKFYLYGDADQQRAWNFSSPNLVEPTVFGGQHLLMGETPPVETQCVEEDREVDFKRSGTGYANTVNWPRIGYESNEPFTLGDLSAVPTVKSWSPWDPIPPSGGTGTEVLDVVPGDPGAPVLDGVVVDDEGVVTLSASGYSGVLEYRWWTYNGFVPGIVRKPFLPYGGSFALNGKGIHSFQVRSRNSDGSPTGHSNVVYALLEIEEDLSVDRGLVFLVPPERATPMPTPVVGSRPDRPVLVRVEEMVDRPGWVTLVLGQDYPENLEYRVWPHSGFQPGALDPAVTLADPLPFIEDRQKFWGTPPERFGDRVNVGGIEVPMAWYFQVRLVDAYGVVSEPSDAWFEMFWQVPAEGTWVDWMGVPE